MVRIAIVGAGGVGGYFGGRLAAAGADVNFLARGAHLAALRAAGLYIDSPNGKLFTQDGNRGSVPTGPWVSDGMTFYLQDVTGGRPLTTDYTLATLVVHLQSSGTSHASLFFSRAGRIRG